MVPFAAYVAAGAPNAFQWAGHPAKVALLLGMSRPPKRHLDRFTRFAGHICVTSTQTDTDTPRYMGHL